MTIAIDIPQRGSIELQHAVFDVNGTLAVDGVAIDGIGVQLKALAEQISIHLLTSGVRGDIKELEQALGTPIRTAIRGEEKMRYVQNLGPGKVVAFGSGANDVSMLRLAALGIVVMTAEGISTKALQGADIVANSPRDAIDLLLKPQRLIATLQS